MAQNKIPLLTNKSHRSFSNKYCLCDAVGAHKSKSFMSLFIYFFSFDFICDAIRGSSDTIRGWIHESMLQLS